MPHIIVSRTGDGRLTASGDFVCALGHRLPGRRGLADGIYAGWSWTGTELRLETDRYGVFPLFTSTSANRCIVASDLTLMLDGGVAATLDYDALSVFLRLGYFVGDDTPFEAIRVVPPVAALRWSASGPDITSGYPGPAATLDVTRDEAIDAFLARVNEAVAGRLSRAPFTLPLAGDCASRHILFALVAARCAPEACVTVENLSPAVYGDVAVAAALCSRLGIPHVKVPHLGDRCRVEREKNRRTHFCAEQHSQFIALTDHLRDVTAVTYHGIGGDLVQGSYQNADVRALCERGDEAAVALYLLDACGTAVAEDALAQLLSPDLLRQVPRERAIARLSREIQNHLEAPDPLSSFLFWNRTRREVAMWPYALMRDIAVYAPFLDPDVFDVLAALPLAISMDGTFHKDAISRAYPRMADVPYGPTCHPTTRRAWQRRMARDVVRDILHAPALRTGALVPGAVATVLDGDGDRMWYAPLAVYLAQLGGLAHRNR